VGPFNQQPKHPPPPPTTTTTTTPTTSFHLTCVLSQVIIPVNILVNIPFSFYFITICTHTPSLSIIPVVKERETHTHTQELNPNTVIYFSIVARVFFSLTVVIQ
jgi:hypothetical protein